MTTRLAGVLVLLAALGSCSAGSEAAMQGRKVDSSGGTVALGFGSRANPAVPPSSDSKSCSDSRNTADTTGGVLPLAKVLVWIDGIAPDKALPAVRRETLVIEHCRFVPSLLAVAVGTTINVLSQDRATHTTRFVREQSNEPVDEIHTMDEGQVVPSERIASRAGIVEARHVEQPSVLAHIAVFDHPYFAVTDEHGAFRIDGLPPGTYTVKVWRQRMSQPGEQRVVVTSGGVGRLELTLTVR